VADDWIGITPGTDGLLILSLIHCLLEAGKIDRGLSLRNGPMRRWLVMTAEGRREGPVRARNAESQPFVIDRATRGIRREPGMARGWSPTWREWQGNRTVFRHMVEAT
jgi:hypothetical protein